MPTQAIVCRACGVSAASYEGGDLGITERKIFRVHVVLCSECVTDLDHHLAGQAQVIAFLDGIIARDIRNSATPAETIRERVCERGEVVDDICQRATDWIEAQRAANV